MSAPIIALTLQFPDVEALRMAVVEVVSESEHPVAVLFEVLKVIAPVPRVTEVMIASA